MRFEDEKDYIMRMIKEMVSVLFSILLGKQYVSVDEERKNGYEVSGTDLNDLLGMIDNGQINEAENLMLDDIDYSDKKGLAAALLFYQYLSEKKKDFLQDHDYSDEEILEGAKQAFEKSGIWGYRKDYGIELYMIERQYDERKKLQ